MKCKKFKHCNEVELQYTLYVYIHFVIFVYLAYINLRPRIKVSISHKNKHDLVLMYLKHLNIV